MEAPKQVPQMITIPSAIYVQIIKRIEHLESHVEALEKFQVLHLLKRLEKLELEKMEVSAAGSAAGGSAAPVEPVLAAAEEPPSKKARLQSAETLDDDALKMLDAVKEVAVAEVAVAEDAKWSVWNEAKRQALKMLDREGVTVAERGPMRKGTLWYAKTKILHEQMMMKMKMEKKEQVVEQASPDAEGRRAEKSASDSGTSGTSDSD